MVLNEAERMTALHELFRDNQHLRVSYNKSDHTDKLPMHHHEGVAGGSGAGDGASSNKPEQPHHAQGHAEKKQSWLRRVSTKEVFVERSATEPPPPPPSGSGSSSTEGSSSDGPKQRLRELLQKPENLVCADCGAHRPTWGSSNLGVFLCTQCAGVHRSLGVHISAILSTKLDDWTHEVGNKRSTSSGAQRNSCSFN